MALGDNSASILFKIKGDASDAIRAFKDTEQASTGLTTSAGSLTAAFNPLTAIAAAGAVAITAVATAAIAGTRALFEMSKSAADFGSEIFDASQKTGLSAERLTAMKFAADQAGTSLETVTAGSARFAKTIGEAANGSEKAQAKLDRLGVSSYDLDTALKQALKTIVALPPGTAQMTAAMDAFGKSGADLLPFIKSFDGDLDALTEKAKGLGVTMTDEAAAAADEFGDQLDTLNAQFTGITNTIGLAFMPVFNDMAVSVSDFLKRNKDEIASWATYSANFLRGVIDLYNDFRLAIADLEAGTHSLSGTITGFIAQLVRMDPILRGIVWLWERWAAGIDAVAKRGEATATISGFASGTLSPALGVGVPRGGGGGRSGKSDAEREREKAEREAEALARRDLAAQIKIEAGNLKTVQDTFNGALDNLRKSLNAGTDLKAFQDAIALATKQGVDNLLASLTHLEELERQQLKADATTNERAALQQEQEKRRQELRKGYAKEITDLEDARWEEQLRRGEVQAEREQQDFERRLEQAAALEAALGGALGRTVTGETVLPEEEEGTIFDQWNASWDEFFENISENAPTLGGILGDLANIAIGAFDGMARALGSVLQQWILYGNTGPAIMRKILASALATIAAEAAVRAIYELAWGFASLAVQDYEGAAMHFGSAALFGSIAAVTAIAGRAVAGNAFQQQTAGAGAPTGSNRQAGRPEGGAYSSEEDMTIEQGINRPTIQGNVSVKLTLDSNGVIEVLKENVRLGGAMRNLIIDTANA